MSTGAPTLLASRKFPGATPILTVTPAGAIVVGDGDGIRIYEASTFAGSGSPGPVIDLPGAITATTAGFARVSFSTDGRWMSLAQIANAGGRISVWDLETKQSIGSSFNWLQSSTPGRPDDAFMARDGSYVVSSSDGATVIWDLDVVGWLGDVCLGAGRNLTEAEWIKYFPGREYRITCDRWPAKPQP